jgi:hypothetical protein
MKIEKGVPIPNQGGRGKRQSIAKSMEVNDSVFFPTPKEGYAFSGAHGLRAALNRLGMKAVTRQVEGGIRVWRVE